MVDLKLRKKNSASKQTKGQKVYFFSDVHLSLGSREEELKKEAILINFLDNIKHNASDIYIVGDLFDYWFEYRTVVLKGFIRLFSKLAELTGKGIRISLICGNHDYWVKTYLKEEMDINVYTNPLDTKILGKRFLIHHGDGLIKKDVGYRILKKILRNKINIFLYYLLHPDIATWLAKLFSRTSRNYNKTKKYEDRDMIEFSKSRIEEGYDFVIMGHNHIPKRLIIHNGVYVNLGDWISNNTYAVFDGKKIELKKWIN